MSATTEIFTPSNHHFEQAEPIVTSTTNKTSVSVLESFEQFSALEDEWNTLLKQSSCDTVFMTWEWVSTWWEFFHENNDLWMITCRDEKTNQLVGIAPLIVKNTHSLGLQEKTLTMIGNGSAAPDHLDFIIHNDYIVNVSTIFVEQIWAARSQWQRIVLDGIVSNSNVLTQLLERTGSQKQVTQNICPYLTLPEDWTSLKQSYGKSMRYNLGRFERRLERDYPGVINFKKITELEEVDDFISVLVELHTASQQRKNNDGLFSNQTMIDFHTKLAKVFLEAGFLRSYTLNVGQTSIAALHCFQYNGVVSFYQSGFDQFWQRYSPGTQIMSHVIQEAILEKNIVFDFLRGEEDYKFKWTESYATEQFAIIPLGLQSKVQLGLKKAARKLL